MPKNKEQKKKDRERRVAQKKLAEVQKRTQEQKTSQTQKGSQRTNVLTSAAAPPKPNVVATNAKHSFGRRRSVG